FFLSPRFNRFKKRDSIERYFFPPDSCIPRRVTLAKTCQTPESISHFILRCVVDGLWAVPLGLGEWRDPERSIPDHAAKAILRTVGCTIFSRRSRRSVIG